MIKCDPPKDRHLHQEKDRQIKLRVLNTGFGYEINVNFGPYIWNKKSLDPPKSSDPPKSNDPPKSSDPKKKPEPEPSHHSSGNSGKGAETPPFAWTHYLLVFSIAGFIFLLIFIYCHRKQQFYDMNDIADLASLDAS